MLKNQKILFSEARELATSVSAVYERNATEVETWPPDTVKLKSHEAAAMWRDKWDRIHNITRSSAAIVCCDEALDPIRNTLNTCAPTLEQDNKDRAVLITDYDSFRRRLKGMETKRETKGSEINQGTLGELNKEISHFQAKVQAGGKEYDELNEKIKRDMIATKITHDEVIETMLVTFVTAQVHLFSRAAKELDEILRLFPAAKVPIFSVFI